MVDAQATLDTLRNIKNSIIGNPTAKKSLAADGTISRVLEWITANERINEPIFEQIRIEAAHIIAAQAYGPPQALLSVLETQAPQALVTALKHARNLDAPRLTIALTRALRSVVSAAADTIGPIRWHFQRDAAHPARHEAPLVLEDIFSIDALSVILPLLAHPEPDVRRNVAILIARGLVVDAHRIRVFDYDGRAAVWDLIKMLNGDVRNQSGAAYALAEIARDNDAMARFLTERLPPDAMDRQAGGRQAAIVERGRPSVRIPVSGAEPGSLLSLTRPDSVRASPDTFRVLDLICKFLPSRDGDLREAACLCLSTTLRQLRPTLRDTTHAMVMWLNLAIEEFAPTPDPTIPVQDSDPASSSETKTAEINGDPKTAWMQKCRWRKSEVGGGEIARRVVGACHILADFVNDREDLLAYVIHAGTLQRAVRALLILPPIPIPQGKLSPALSGRWGPGTTSSTSVPVPLPTPAISTIAPSSAGRFTIIAGPPSPTRTRRASSAQAGSQPTGSLTPLILTTTGPGPVIRPGPTSPGRPIAFPTSPIPGMAPTLASPPPPPIVPVIPGSPPSPVARRLSFAELARRASESGAEGFSRRTPSQVRRTSSAGVGAIVTATAGSAAPVPTSPRPDDAMAVDSDTPANVSAPGQDVTMQPADPVPAPAPGSAPVDHPQSVDVVMKTENVAPSSATPAPIPFAPAPAPAPMPATRRRKKPPPDPALGPYTYHTSTPTPKANTAPQAPAPPAPESTLRAALLVLLAAFTMHSDEHRRMLVEAGALGGVVPPGRRLGPGGVIVPGSGPLKPGELQGVTGVLGALGSPDPEVRWAGATVARAIGRSTGVLRTGLYDSGIGRAVFDMFMHGEPDRRVLVAVLRVCCNLLNQYSPMREMFIRDGGMQKMTELCDAEEQTVRVLALWAFKNSVFRATLEDKRTIMATLTWTRLERILEEAPGELLEQALGIVRNLSATEADAEWLVVHLTPSKLVEAAERTIGLDESSSLASLFALAHVAFIPSVRSLVVNRRRILEYIAASLGHSEVQVRSAAALCVSQMAGCTPRRMREMREAGIDGRLKVLRGRETDEEVRDNMNRALYAFESRDA